MNYTEFGERIFKFGSQKYCTYAIRNEIGDTIKQGVAYYYDNDTHTIIEDENEEERINKLIEQEFEQVKKEFCKDLIIETISLKKYDCHYIGYILDDCLRDSVDIFYQIRNTSDEKLFYKYTTSCSKYWREEEPHLFLDSTISYEDAMDFISIPTFVKEGIIE